MKQPERKLIRCSRTYMPFSTESDEAKNKRTKQFTRISRFCKNDIFSSEYPYGNGSFFWN